MCLHVCMLAIRVRSSCSGSLMAPAETIVPVKQEMLVYTPRRRCDFHSAAVSSAVVRGARRSSHAIGYATDRSRSHDAVIRVYEAAVNVIEMHEHGDDFKEW